jgi:hypothetical protein
MPARFVKVLIGPVAVLIAVSACAAPGGPARIEVVPPSAAAADAAPAIAPAGPVQVQVVGELPALDGRAVAHRTAGRAASAQDAARLAAAFGIAGAPADSGAGSWTVGPQDGSGPTLTVSADPLGQWWYSAAPDTAVCAEVGPGGETRPCRSADAPPPSLPTDDAAQAAAARLVEQIGIPAGAGRIVRDEWGVSVEYPVLVEGVSAPVGTAFRFTDGDRPTSANGTLGAFTAAGSYPRIGTAAALDLVREGNVAPWFGMAAGAAEATDADADADADAGSGGASTDGSGGMSDPDDPGAPAPGDAVPPAAGDGAEPVPPSDDLPVPPPPADPEPVVITVVAAEAGLTLLTGADGTSWLIPAYLFTTAEGATIEVLAVPADFIEVVQPGPVPMPAVGAPEAPAVSP